MRLTLRTMLAYLDDILDSKDASELGEKIEESSFASDLVHRIRTSTRRLRLGAPKLMGDGMGLDPNTVAEYLDNTLPSDQVPEFEKVCLESDVHLAEVASCHQVLTIVLGEPAEINQPLRERMYRVGHDAVSAASQSAPDSVTPPPMPTRPTSANGAAAEGAPATPAASTAETISPVRGSRQTGVSVKSLAITLLCTFVVAVVALRGMGRFDHTHVAYRLLFGQGDNAEVAKGGGEAPQNQRADNKRQGVNTETPQAGLPVTKATGGNLEETKAAPTTVTVPPVVPKVDDVASSDPSIPATVTPELNTLTAPGAVGDVTPATVSPDTTSPETTSPETTSPGTTSPETASPETIGPAATPATVLAPAVGGRVAATPKASVAPAVNVGRYVAEDQILARFDASKDDWYQVPNASILRAGDRLITFPTYRPHAVIGDINVTFVHASSVELMSPNEAGQPRLEVHYGRAVLLPFKAGAGRIALKIGGVEGHIVFGDVESVAAIRVLRYLAPGVDPEKSTAKHVFQLYATSGRVGWSETGAETIVVDAGRMLARIDSATPSVVDAGPMPAWIEGRDMKDIERRASVELRTTLEKDQPLSRSLMEMTSYRKHEVVDLACRSLSYLGVYDPLVKALGDKRQHYYWHDQFDELRSIGTRNPDAAAALRRMMEKLHAGDAATLYRLTWGYSSAQLSGGGDIELVDLLENDSMSLRVMAFKNLEAITGGVTKNFRPDMLPSQEKTKVANWRRALKEGAIVYKTPPSPWSPSSAEAGGAGSR